MVVDWVNWERGEMLEVREGNWDIQGLQGQLSLNGDEQESLVMTRTAAFIVQLQAYGQDSTPKARSHVLWPKTSFVPQFSASILKLASMTKVVILRAEKVETR